MKSCEVGDCELKLGETALQRIRKEVDWSKPLPEATSQVEALFKRLSLDYVIRYQAEGNQALAAYRDTRTPTFVAQEFKTMIDRMPLLTNYLPQLKAYLLEFPTASLPGAESFLYWQSAKFGLKPTIRINHVVIVEQPDGAAVATKMLYANHYFWTAIELRVLLPDPARGKGFWFVSVSHSRSDGLGGYSRPDYSRQGTGRSTEGYGGSAQAGKASLEKS